MEDNLLTFQQVQARLGGRSASSVYRDVAAGRIPKPRKLGARVFWDASKLDQAIDALPEADEKQAA